MSGVTRIEINESAAEFAKSASRNTPKIKRAVAGTLFAVCYRRAMSISKIAGAEASRKRATLAGRLTER